MYCLKQANTRATEQGGFARNVEVMLVFFRYRHIAHDVTVPVMMHLEDKFAIYAKYNFCKQSKYCKTL
jgi:hypothetical protein